MGQRIFKDINKLIPAVDSLLSGKNGRVLIVAVDDVGIYSQLRQHLANTTVVKCLSSYCPTDDSFPERMFLDEIEIVKENTLWLGVSEYIRQIDKDVLRRIVSICRGKIGNTVANSVVLLFGCNWNLREIQDDPRDVECVWILETGNTTSPKVVFIDASINIGNNVDVINGYKKYLELIEQNYGANAVVSTGLTGGFSHNSPGMMIVKTAFDYIVRYCNLPSEITESMGSSTNWQLLLGHLNGRTFGEYTNIGINLSKWKTADEYTRWKYWLALKIQKSNDHSYLNFVVNRSQRYETFIDDYWELILEIDYKNLDFERFYQERKSELGNIKYERINCFISPLQLKKEVKIYYLTDTTTREKEEILCWLAAQTQFEKKTLDILKTRYKDLYYYLKESFRQEEPYNTYFRDYKTQKIQGTISDGFIEKVNAIAMNRPYNTFPTRNEVFLQIDKTDTLIYFVDCLCVEHIDYIYNVCSEMKMKADVISIARANIPTTTERNKDFLQGIDGIKEDQELDKLKHSGSLSDDDRIPLYLVKELAIIKCILEDIKEVLGKKRKVVIVSDHGATRLAVINKCGTTYKVQGDVERGGRYCDIRDDNPSIQFATKENGYYVLANYDRFSVQGAPKVETHGGATLEEVLVPLIKITNEEIKAEINCINTNLAVKINQKPFLEFSVSTKPKIVRVKVESKFYDSDRDKMNAHCWKCQLDITKPGEYIAEVFADNNNIGSIEFKITRGVKEQQFDI